MSEVVEDKITCPHCGAPLPLQQGEIIVVCQYCSSAIQLKANAKYFLKHSMIPAKSDEAAITESVHAWMSGGFYKPDDLARKAKIRKMECTYMPFFVFDVKAKLSYGGKLTRLGPAVDKTGTIERDMQWKVLARRASKFPTMEYKIPLAGKVDFDVGKMVKGASFLNAEMDEVEAMEVAKEQVRNHLLQLAAKDVDDIARSDIECKFDSTEFVHAPVWRVMYEYKKAFYKMYMDGATGDTIRAEVPPPDTSLKGLIKSVTSDIVR